MGVSAGNIPGARAEGTSPDQVGRCSGNPSAIIVSGEEPRFKTDEEVLRDLAGEGFVDADTDGARYILERVSYQHLRPYLSATLRMSPDRGHSVKTAHDALTFDRDLKASILKHIGVFEGQMRARYGHLIAEAHGPFPIYDEGLFLNAGNHAKTLGSFREEVSKRATRERGLADECSAHGGRLPIWRAVECMTLGTLCHFYANTRDNSVTGAVAASFGASKAELVNWSKTITQVRNICAHFEPYIIRKEIPSTPMRIKGCECPRRTPLFIVVLLAKLLGAHSADPRNRGLDYGLRVRLDARTTIGDFESFSGGVVPIPGFPLNWRTLLDVSREESERADWRAGGFTAFQRMHGKLVWRRGAV